MKRPAKTHVASGQGVLYHCSGIISEPESLVEGPYWSGKWLLQRFSNRAETGLSGLNSVCTDIEESPDGHDDQEKG
jgi:hypothetical protein